MMYVYYTEKISEEIMKKIIDKGNAVRIDPDEDMFLLSKTDRIVIDGEIIESEYSLEEYIKFYDGGDIIRLAGIEITMMETIEILLDSLYEICNEKHQTYAERIYNSNNPRYEIKKIINEFLIVRMDMVMSDLKLEINKINKQIEDGTLKWE